MSTENCSEKKPDEETTSLRGIPTMEFIENLDEYMARVEFGNAVEAALKRLEESHQRYKIVEASLTHKRAKFRVKLPDLKHSLELVEVLDEKRKASEETQTRFLLSDQCYAMARIPPSDKVCLWLGANVMLEYTIEEARKLLTDNINGAEKGIKDLGNQLDFIKDQLTTTEVNIARIYNWGVQRRKATAGAAAGDK